MARTAHFRVEYAFGNDILAIHSLVFQRPDPFLRRLTVNEVEDLVDRGMFWVIRDFRHDKMIGACYVSVPISEPGHGPEPAEYGGVFVHEDYRDKGIASLLSNVAIARYFWDNSPETATPIPLIAHVHIRNMKPRSLLKKLGFEIIGRVIVPENIPGFEHMPKDPGGKIHGDEFKFNPQKRVQLFHAMADMLGRNSMMAKDGSKLRLEFRFEPEFSPAALKDLAKLIESLP